ncbi:hypothetical protein, partial [Hyella patelloides]
MNEQSNNKTFKEDGIRPIESTDVNIVDTFEEDGTRPIAESPDFLVRNRQDKDNLKAQKSENKSTEKNNSEIKNTSNENKVLEIDGQRPVDSSSTEVVDTFEADGKRPIMANKYQVVGTLDIDGERPITQK